MALEAVVSIVHCSKPVGVGVGLREIRIDFRSRRNKRRSYRIAVTHAERAIAAAAIVFNPENERSIYSS